MLPTKETMYIQILLLVFGMALLIKGADWLVSGASALAKKYNIPDLTIGLTIVAFGTSAPELVVNVIASANGLDDIVFGNILGSNIANLFLILGVTGIIYPLIVKSRTIWRQIPFSLFVAILLFLLANNFFYAGTTILSRVDGIILLSLFVIFMVYVYHQLQNDTTPNEINAKSMTLLKTVIFIVTGMLGLVIGGKLVVDNAVKIASILGVSEKIIGFTIVAIGTSLPELATSVVAAFKKNTNIAVGNIIGSNIFNVLLIIAISSIVKPMSFNTVFNNDFYLLGGGTLLLFAAMFSGGRKKLDRWEAAILLAIYIGYMAFLISREV